MKSFGKEAQQLSRKQLVKWWNSIQLVESPITLLQSEEFLWVNH